MKKLIYITLIALTSTITCGDLAANAIESKCVVGPKTNGEPVYCRIFPPLMEAHLFFHGQALRIGDNVLIRIYDVESGALVQQEQLVGNGGGAIEKFSIDGLDTGMYTLEITGEIYNTSHVFVIP